MQQRYQLAIQQAYAIGGFLKECITQHHSESTPDVPQQRSRGWPNCNSLLDILDGIDELGVSSSSFQDQIAIFNTVSRFPLLNYVNEPMSHFVSAEVRSVIVNLPARIHHTCDVPSNIYVAYNNTSPYRSVVCDQGSPELSDKIRYPTVIPCDGDGLVMNINIDSDKPLENAVFARLFGIDAPELAAIHFVKTDDFKHVYSKRMGHLSLCAVHLFLRMFVLCGTADLCEEIPVERMDPPHDFYGRPLKEFWFKYTTPPSDEMEARFLAFVEQLVSAQSELRKRLMSPFPVCHATATSPFLLSLNALLVVTGFCHVFTRYCQDKLLLGLQQVAKENKMGPIWCGASRNFIYGCNSDNSADYILKQFNLETTMNLERQGYPYKKSSAFLPWHERKTDLFQPNHPSTSSRPPSSAFTRERTPVWHLHRDYKVDKYNAVQRPNAKNLKSILKNHSVTHKKQCFNTFPNIGNRVENMMCSGLFMMNFEMFGNVINYSLKRLIYLSSQTKPKLIQEIHSQASMLNKI